MTDFSIKHRPSEPEAFLFSYALSVYSILAGFVPKRLRSVTSQLLFTISPGVPVDLRKSLSDRGGARRLIIVSFFAGIFFCFGVTAFFCWLDGTLMSSDPTRLSFLQDRWNIKLYLVVCPIYIALANYLIFFLHSNTGAR